MMFEKKEKDAFYFPHFCNARHDRKIRKIRKELGVEGYGIFFMILEVLREQSDFRYPMEDIDILADEIGTSEQKVETVLKRYDLFQFDENDNFTSENQVLYLAPMLEGKLSKKISGYRGNLIRHKHLTKEVVNGMSNAQIVDFITDLGWTSRTESLCDSVAVVSGRKESKLEETKLEETKQKDIKKESGFSSYQPPLKKNKVIIEIIDLWNSFENLPACEYKLTNISFLSDILTKIDLHGQSNIEEAIKTLSELYDDLTFGKTTSFKNFFVNDSVDSWVPSANPRKVFKGISASSFTPDKWKGVKNFDF